jgi:hypothetical protein
MRIVPVYIRGRCEQSGPPKEKVSRYTVRPGTLGLTLASLSAWRKMSSCVAAKANTVARNAHSPAKQLTALAGPALDESPPRLYLLWSWLSRLFL